MQYYFILNDIIEHVPNLQLIHLEQYTFSKGCVKKRISL